MRLPIVTHVNLAFCTGLLDGLTERRAEMLRNVMRFPLELSVDNEQLQFHTIVASQEEVELLIFGLGLLVKTVEETPRSLTVDVASTVYSLLRHRVVCCIESLLRYLKRTP